MILLIDGYNVLKQAMPSVKIRESERKKFIEQLGRYAKLRQHKIILVFDGGPYDRSVQERIAGVYVIFSGAIETADHYIKRYLKEHKSHDILLISSDNELRSAAARLNIESMRSPEFYRVVLESISPAGKQRDNKTETIKTTDTQDEELDAIMREGSKVVQSKVEDFVGERKTRASKAHKLSKKERKRMKKIKKL